MQILQIAEEEESNSFSSSWREKRAASFHHFRHGIHQIQSLTTCSWVHWALLLECVVENVSPTYMHRGTSDIHLSNTNHARMYTLGFEPGTTCTPFTMPRDIIFTLLLLIVTLWLIWYSIIQIEDNSSWTNHTRYVARPRNALWWNGNGIHQTAGSGWPRRKCVEWKLSKEAGERERAKPRRF